MNATFEEVILSALAMDLPKGWSWVGFVDRPRFHEVQVMLDGPAQKTVSFHVSTHGSSWKVTLEEYAKQATRSGE